MNWPKIASRHAKRVSPWVELIELGVEFSPGAAPEIYHAVGQQDYIAIVVRTADGLIPIVRQFRPVVGDFTWELPAGIVDAGETPEETCRRELLEETGLSAQSVYRLGSYWPCTARLANKVHSFFAEAGPHAGQVPIEEGIELRLVTPHELGALILAGQFGLQLHIGALMLAGMQGHLDLSALR